MEEQGKEGILMHGDRVFGKRFEIAVRIGPGPDDFAPMAGFDTYEEASDAAHDCMAMHWDYTTAYAFVGSIVDNATPEMPGHRVASIEGQCFTVTNVQLG